MPVHDLRLLIALSAILSGLGTLLLTLALLHLASTAARGLYLRLSPTAARHARFHAALAAYQSSFAKCTRKWL